MRERWRAWIIPGASAILLLYVLAVTAVFGGGSPRELAALVPFVLAGLAAFILVVVRATRATLEGDRLEAPAPVEPPPRRRAMPRKRPVEDAEAGPTAADVLRGLMDYTSALIYTVDREGRFIRVNNHFQRVFRVTGTAVVGQTYADLFPPDVAEALRANEAEVLRTRQAVEVAEMLPHEDGLHPYLSLKFPITDATGRLTGLCAVSRDDAETREAHERFLAAQETAYRELNRAQELQSVATLAGGLAHDFKNTLTVILGSAEMGLFTVSEDGPGWKEFTRIQAAGERAADLAQQLLVLSRPTEETLVPTDLNDVIAHAAELLRRSIPGDIEVRVRPTTGLPSVRANANQLEQVFLNLGVNARDAMPNGGRVTYQTTEIDLDERAAREIPDARPGRFICVTVTDNGGGIPPDLVKKIFEPFFTTKEVGRGTGLGLAMVHRCVHTHQGWITVDSVRGRGTMFSLYFPAIADEAEAAQRGGHTVAPRREFVRGLETILLVDDDDVVRDLCAEGLTACGYDIVAAEDGEHALAMLGAHDGPVDLVLTDLVMPRLGGRALLTALRQRGYDTPVVMMTGNGQREVVDLVTDGQIADVLHKPFTPQDLSARIRHVLDARGHSPADTGARGPG